MPLGASFSARAKELCANRGGRPGLPSLMSLAVYVDVKRGAGIAQWLERRTRD